MSPTLQDPAHDTSEPGRVSPNPVSVSEAVTREEWDAYVDAHPAAVIYHLWNWREVFTRTFGHQTVYLAARRDGRLVGILPLVQFESWLFGRFFVSLPFVNYGGVLASDAAAAEALVAHATSLATERRLSHVELRHLDRLFPALPARQHKVTMRMPLPSGVDEAFEGLDRRVRNHVRKGEKSQLVVVSGGTDLLADFYKVFAHNMRDLGTPVYSRKLFEAVLEAFPDRAHVFVARLGDRPVAGAFMVTYRDTVEVPWASSLKQFRSLNANTLIYWEMIKWAITHRFGRFDFGRSTPGDGPYTFKAQWGASPEPLAWEYSLVGGQSIPDQSPKNPKFSLAISLWQKLPVPVATLLGPSIVRSIP